MFSQLINAALGIWLMVAPAVLGYGGAERVNDRIVGPVATMVAIIATSEVTRAVRWINVLLGVWLIIAPWLLGYQTTGELVNSIATGVLLVIFASRGGRVDEKFGGGWSALFRSQGVGRET